LLNIGVCLLNRNPCRHAQKLTILKKIKNAKLFWGGGHPLFKLNVTPPEKNPSYGLA